MPLYTIVEQREAKGFPLGPEIAKVKRKSEDRFHVGDKISISKKPFEEFKIVEAIPATNPEGVDVTYVVEYMSDLNKQAGGDIIAFPSYILRRKRTQFW